DDGLPSGTVKVPDGRPSSVAEPFSVKAAGIETAPPGPAFTTGGWLIGIGFTTSVTSEEGVNSVSLAVRRRTYVPIALIVACVIAVFGELKPTEAGPEI